MKNTKLAMTSLSGDLDTDQSTLDMDLPNCSCSTDSDWCGGVDVEGPPTQKCKKEVNSCKRLERGCGFLWVWACDGLCYDIE